MPKFYQLPAQQSVLPPWVQAMTKGAVGPGDLASPMEAPVMVAAKAPAIMRKMGEALLKRLAARGLPEDAMGPLRDMQARWPRYFGHIDDVKPGAIPLSNTGVTPGVSPIARSVPRYEDPLRPSLSPKEKKFSTILIDLEKAREKGGIPFALAHEGGHGAQRIMNPTGMLPAYREQLQAGTELLKDPQAAYDLITYERNANISGGKFAAEYAGGKKAYPNDVAPSKRLVQRVGRAGDAMTPKPVRHPSLQEIKDNYREMLIKLMSEGK